MGNKGLSVNKSLEKLANSSCLRKLAKSTSLRDKIVEAKPRGDWLKKFDEVVNKDEEKSDVEDGPELPEDVKQQLLKMFDQCGLKDEDDDEEALNKLRSGLGIGYIINGEVHSY